ncbi:MAG: hypothetical protein AAB973_02770, partial [Patescibacteria group bacterium]
SLSFTPYLHLAILVLASSALAIFGYNQIFKEAKSGQAFPTALVRPTRQLAFQGRLTDQDGRPIGISTNVAFKLYNQAESGTEVYSVPTCTVTPDENGIFSTQIGNGICGTEIGPEVFSENTSLFLEVAIGGQSLIPRQPIATSGYALNSETLQGYPASASATENTIPVVNNDGAIILGAASPTLLAENGTFAIKGQAVTLATTPGTDGDVTVAPDGRGSVNLIGSLDRGIFVNVTDANLTTGTLIEGYVANNSRTGTLLHLASGTKQVNRLTIYTTGQTDIIADTYTKPAFSIKQTGSGPIFSAKTGQTRVAQLSASGDFDLLGGLSLGGRLLADTRSSGRAGVIFNQNNSGPIFAASASGTPRFVIANNGNVGINTINPTEGALVVSGRTWTDEFTLAKRPVSGYILTSDSGGNAAWSDPTIVGNWQRNSGALAPVSVTDDVLLGATATASAKFAFLNVGSGTPTASIAGSSTNAASYLTGDGLLGTRNSQSLTLGAAGTGNIVLSPGGTTALTAVGANLTAAGTLTLPNSNSLTGVANYLRLSNGLSVGGADTYYLNSSGTGNLNALTLAGNLLANGDTTLGNAITDNITFTGRVALDSDLIPIGTTGTNDLGSSALPWDNLYVDNIYSSGTIAGFWQRLLGVLSPANSTDDLALGGTATSSAKFQIFADTGSATAAGNLTLTGTAPTLATRLFRALTLGDSQTGDILLSPGTGKNVGIGTTAPDNNLDIVGSLDVSGTTEFGNLAYTWPTTQTANYVLATNGSGSLSWGDPAVLAGATIYWTQASGSLFPKNSTVDAFIGGQASSSAKFAFLNVGSGTPTASI